MTALTSLIRTALCTVLSIWPPPADGNVGTVVGVDNNVGTVEGIYDNVGTVLGIDLGTAYSSVGMFRNGRVEIIPNEQGRPSTPSYIAITRDGRRLIGDLAKNHMTTYPENTIFNSKRWIGRTWDAVSVQKEVKLLPFVAYEKDTKLHAEIDTPGVKAFLVEEISAMVLRKMKDLAEAYLGENVTHAVVSVPASFSEAQRQATKDAGFIAGLTIIRLLNEPTAAALAYGYDTTEKQSTLIVFDMGAGSFDVSVIIVGDGLFEVVASRGSTHLGGEDFDQRVMNYFLDLYEKKTGKVVRNIPMAVQRLRREVEKAKIALSSLTKVTLEIEDFHLGNNFLETLTRREFDNLNMDLFLFTVNMVRSVLKDAGLGKNEIDEVVLVGGSTRIPKIQHLVREFFDGSNPNCDLNHVEAVAFGAALYAGVLAKKDNHPKIVVVEINPFSFGININKGEISELIQRNKPVPIKRSEIFSTASDNQPNVNFQIFQSGTSMNSEYKLVGEISLEIKPAPKGVPKIEVTFKIDVNGILQVTAKDKVTGNRKKLTVKSNKLSKKDIIRMAKYSESYALKDKKLEEREDAKDKLENHAYWLESQVDDKEKPLGMISEKSKSKIRDAAREAIEWLEENDKAEKDVFDFQRKKLKEKVNRIAERDGVASDDRDQSKAKKGDLDFPKKQLVEKVNRIAERDRVASDDRDEL